jgi:hypothetical protein
MRANERQAFRSNPNKDFLRSSYDKAIIEAWQGVRGAPLHYMGLPGPEMLDIIEWQDCIERFTTIERLESEQHHLFLRANVKDVEHRLHSLYGDFDKIILTGRDKYNISPRWPYDLFNLDFFGGFIYRNMNRPKAVRKLIDNQSGYKRSFLLIITHDIRDGDLVGEKLSFLDDLGRALERDFGQKELIEGFVAAYKGSATPDAARQVLYMSLFLRDNGEMAQFRVHSRPAVIYSGTGGARMVHFVTEFHYQTSEHRAVSDQSLHEVVNLGLQELSDGALRPVQVPLLPKLGL